MHAPKRPPQLTAVAHVVSVDIDQDYAHGIAVLFVAMGVRVKIGSHHYDLPRSRVARMAIGVALIVAGLLGFLPVIGFWMLPLGLLILAVDLPVVRRFNRRVLVWWYKNRARPPPASRAKRDDEATRSPEPGP